jgi:hypothetical protein
MWLGLEEGIAALVVLATCVAAVYFMILKIKEWRKP